VYASSTSALATGSALTFSGTNLVTSTGASSTAVQLQNNTAQMQIVVPTSGGSNIQFYKDNNPSYVGAIGTYNPLNNTAQSALIFSDYQGSWIERMRLTSAGFLGIGTSSPSWPLSVKTSSSGTASTFIYDGTFAGTDEVNLGLRFYNGGSASDTPQVKLRAYGTSNYTGNFAVSILQGGTYPNPLIERFTIQGTNGYVGIGTTSPSQLLSVAGNGLFGTQSGTRVDITGAGGASAIQETYSSESNYRWAIGRDALGGGKAGLIFNDGGNPATDGSGIGFTSSASTLGFYTSNGSSLVERARIDSSGTLCVNTTSDTSGMNGTAKLAIGQMGIKTMSAGYQVTLDTGIPVNQGANGGTLMLMVSGHTSDQFATQSALYLIQFPYNGDYTPNKIYIAGQSDFVTVGTTGSAGNKTLTLYCNSIPTYTFFMCT
jgi:hypothetical protein